MSEPVNIFADKNKAVKSIVKMSTNLGLKIVNVFYSQN